MARPSLEEIFGEKPKESVTKDVAKSIGSNLAVGALYDAAMVVPNLLNQAVAGPQYLYEGLVGKDRPDFQPWQPFYSSDEAAQKITPGLVYEPKTTAGKVAAFPSRILGGVAGGKGIQKAGNSSFAKDTTSGKPVKEKVTSSDVKQASQAAYEKAGMQGAKLKAGALDEFIDDVDKLKFKSPKAAELTGDGELTRVQQVIGKWKGQELSFDDIDDIDKALTKLIDKQVVNGQMTPDGRDLYKVQSRFRQAIENVPGNEALKEARGLWSAKSKMTDLERIVERATNMQNPSTGIQTGARQLMADKTRFNRYSPQEQKMIAKAAKTGMVTDLLRQGGSRLVAIGNAVTGGPLQAAGAAAGSTLSREGANALQMNRINKVAASVAKNAMPQPKPSLLQQMQQAKTARVQGDNFKQAVGALPFSTQGGVETQQEKPSLESIFGEITPQSLQAIEQQPLFDKAFQHVLDVEGGYVADDAGKGETNMGVNITANPDVDVKNLTKPEARNIYKKRYWDAIGADNMPPALAMVAFDGAVNQGVGKTKELLKKAGGDPMKLLQLREQHYANLIRLNPKKFAKYGNGWMDRLKKLEQMIMEG